MTTLLPPGPPTVRSLRYELGLALATDGRVRLALDSLEAALDEHGPAPAEADIRHELGRLYEEVDVSTAFRHHVKAALVAPERGEVLLAPALRLLESRSSLAGDSVLSELRSRLDDADPWFDGARAAGVALLGRAALARRDLDEATRLFERGRALDASSADALAGLAEVARRQGRLDDAAELLRDALQAASVQRDRERAGRYGSALVDVHIDNDDYERADAVLKVLESLGANDDAVRLSRAVVELAQGNAGHAALLAGELIESRVAAAALRVQAQGLTVVAVLAGSDGDYAPAEAAARHSTELEATSTDALLVLAQVLIESNGETQAREGMRLLTSVAELLDTDTRLPHVVRRAMASRPNDVDLCFIAASLLAARTGDDDVVSRSLAQARTLVDRSTANGSLARRCASGLLLLDAALRDRAGEPALAAALRSSAAEKLRDDQQWTASLEPLELALEVDDATTTRWMLADSLLMIATSTYPFDQERIARGTTIWDAGLAMAEPAYEWRWIYLTRGHLASARAARSDDGGQRAYWEALCWFETALAADPQRTSIWTRIAEAANLGYLYEYGIDALEGAIALAPTDVAAIAEHAALLVNTGRVSAALAAVSAARALGDLAGSDTYIDKIESFCHVLQRNYADALALVEQALVIAPTDQWSLFTRFWIRRQLRLDGAEDDLALIEQALSLDPDNHRAHANLLVMRGRFDEALARLDQLAAVDDLALQDPNVLGTKLTCLAALGRAEHRAVLDSVVQLSRYAPEVSSVVDHSIPWALEQVSDQVARSMLVQAGVELAALVSRLSAGRTLDDDLMTLDHEASQSIERGSWGRLLGTMIGARRSGWITPDLTDVRADLPLAGQVLCDRYVGLVGLAATLANPGDTMAGQDAAAQDPAAQDPAARDASGTAPSTPDASGTA